MLQDPCGRDRPLTDRPRRPGRVQSVCRKARPWRGDLMQRKDYGNAASISSFPSSPSQVSERPRGSGSRARCHDLELQIAWGSRRLSRAFWGVQHNSGVWLGTRERSVRCCSSCPIALGDEVGFSAKGCVTAHRIVTLFGFHPNRLRGGGNDARLRPTWLDTVSNRQAASSV